MRRAPLIVVPHSNQSAYLDRYAEPDKGWTDRDEARWPVPYWDIDTGFAALLMLLTAVDEGLGACFFGIPPERIHAYREAFGVPGGVHPDRGGDDRLPGTRSAVTVTRSGAAGPSIRWCTGDAGPETDIGDRPRIVASRGR